MLDKATVEGVGITSAAPEDILQDIGTGIGSEGPARVVVAINVHTYLEARGNPRYREAMNGAEVAFVDGVPIRWLLKSRGLLAPPRIHGADFMSRCLERYPSARHAFYGSTPETLALLREQLLRRHPGLNCVGFISPPFRKAAERESTEQLRALNESHADFLWVALGAPKQELWAHLNRDQLRIPVIACVGAAFEIHAGRYSRAPGILQRIGLEWAWRLAQNPGRLWRRYFTTNGRFLADLAVSWVSRRPAPLPPPARSSGGS